MIYFGDIISKIINIEVYLHCIQELTDTEQLFLCIYQLK